MRNTFIVLTLVISVLLPGKALATGIDSSKECDCTRSCIETATAIWIFRNSRIE